MLIRCYLMPQERYTRRVSGAFAVCRRLIYDGGAAACRRLPPRQRALRVFSALRCAYAITMLIAMISCRRQDGAAYASSDECLRGDMLPARVAAPRAFTRSLDMWHERRATVAPRFTRAAC